MSRKSLQWQIFSSFLIVIIVIFLTITWFVSNSFTEFYYDHIKEDLRSRTYSVRKQIEQIKFENIDNLCKELGKDLETRITIIVESGEVIGDSVQAISEMDNHADRPEIQLAFAGVTGTSMRYSNTLKQNMVYVATPNESELGVNMVVCAFVSVSSIDDALAGLYWKFIVGGIIIFIGAAFLSLAISRYISRPVITAR